MALSDGTGGVAQWYRDLRAPLRRFLGGRRGLRAADVDDIAQEVFLRLLRYDRETFVDDPRNYLFKVAANVASEWSMRAAQRLPHESAWLDELADSADIIDQLTATEDRAALDQALSRLPVRAREVLRLLYGEGLTRESIGERLGVTSRVVKRDIIRAYAQLRIALSEPGECDATGGDRAGQVPEAKEERK